MRRGRSALGLFTAATALSFPAAAASQEAPEARRSDHATVHHGVEVADPYRWMEDLDDPELRRWARRHDAFAREFVAQYPRRDEIHDRIAAAADHRRYLAPVRRGGRYFFVRANATFTRVSILFRQGLDGGDVVLVDADEQDLGGVVDRSIWPGPEAERLAFGVSDPASRWMEIRVRDVSTGRTLPDRLRGLRARRTSNLSWNPDGSGIWYDGFAPPTPEDRRAARLRGARLAYHELGTDQAEDRIVLRAGPDETIGHRITDDGRWIVATVRDGRGVRSVHVVDASNPTAAPRLLVDDPGSNFTFVGSREDVLWFHTNRDAPNGRVVGVAIDEPDPQNWTTVVPEGDDAIDSWVGIRAVGDVLVGGYRSDGLLELRMFTPGDPGYEVLPLPRVGSVWFGVTGRQGDPEFFYVLSGFVNPGTVFRHDLRTGRSEPLFAPDLPYDPTEFVTRRVFYDGPAGDSIYMYVAHHRDVTPGPKSPVMLYGYAFGGWSASPWFRAHLAEWLRSGGVFALPALRGGGEYGQEWADAGLRTNRQNAVDDFVAASEWLIEQGMTGPGLLVAETNSAGASVVGAALVQRSDLFGAALFGFPLLDILRYHEFTGGARWSSQLGTVEDEEEFHALLAYSPLHNVEPNTCFPATLVTPGENDETTPAFHAYKFVASLRHAQACDAPILLRVAWGAEHAYGRDQASTLESFADQLAFVHRVLRRDTKRMDEAR
ncbi:MAG: prolyl oligopeptidase family serine peptidase [Gemmatimonadota bacterium]